MESTKFKVLRWILSVFSTLFILIAALCIILKKYGIISSPDASAILLGAVLLLQGQFFAVFRELSDIKRSLGNIEGRLE